MKIVFTELQRKWILTLPIVPQDFTWGKNRKRDVLEGLRQDIDVTGNLELRSYTIDSFIPNKGKLSGKKYPFQLTSTPGVDVVKALDYWIDNDTPLRMVVTSKYGNTLENVIVKIIGFEKRLDRAGDYIYTMSLSEHVPISGV